MQGVWDDLREEGRVAPRDIDLLRVGGFVKSPKESLPVGTEQSEAAPIVVSRKDDGCCVSAERIDDSGMKMQKPLDGLRVPLRGRLEYVSVMTTTTWSGFRASRSRRSVCTSWSKTTDCAGSPGFM